MSEWHVAKEKTNPKAKKESHGLSLNMVFLSPTSALSHSPRQKPISNLIQFFETTVCKTQKTKKKSHRWPINQPPSTADLYQQTPSDFRHRFLCRCYALFLACVPRYQTAMEINSDLSPASSGFLWWLREKERDQWNLENRIGLGLSEFGFGS